MGTLTVSDFSHTDDHENVCRQISTAVTQVGEPPMRDLRNATETSLYMTYVRLCVYVKRNTMERKMVSCDACWLHKL